MSKQRCQICLREFLESTMVCAVVRQNLKLDSEFEFENELVFYCSDHGNVPPAKQLLENVLPLQEKRLQNFAALPK